MRAGGARLKEAVVVHALLLQRAAQRRVRLPLALVLRSTVSTAHPARKGNAARALSAETSTSSYRALPAPPEAAGSPATAAAAASSS